MGFMNKIFGGREYPELDAANPATELLNRHKGQLEPFVLKVKDNIEIVPGGNTVYVYIGKPPAAFGLAWFQDGRDVNLKNLISEKGLSQSQVTSLAGKLGEAYSNNKSAERYSAAIAGKKVVVIPSEALATSIAQVLQEVTGDGAQ